MPWSWKKDQQGISGTTPGYLQDVLQEKNGFCQYYYLRPRERHPHYAGK